MSITNAFNRVRREAGIKRCLIVEGNVGDVYLIDRQLHNIKGALDAVLRQSGFDDIVLWDRITGIQGDVNSLKLVEGIPEPDGDDYDLGDVEIPKMQASGACKELGDMFALIQRTMDDEKRHTAFVLDWSEYLFSTGGQLDPMDRQYLTQLGKSLRDSIPRYRGKERQSTVIVVASKSSMIPISFYSNNSEVSIITVTRPDLEERRSMLKKVAPGFELYHEDDIIESPRFEDYVDLRSTWIC